MASKRNPADGERARGAVPASTQPRLQEDEGVALEHQLPAGAGGGTAVPAAASFSVRSSNLWDFETEMFDVGPSDPGNQLRWRPLLALWTSPALLLVYLLISLQTCDKLIINQDGTDSFYLTTDGEALMRMNQMPSLTRVDASAFYFEHFPKVKRQIQRLLRSWRGPGESPPGPGVLLSAQRLWTLTLRRLLTE